MFHRQLVTRLRLFYRRLRRFIYEKILHAEDSPHQLALGLAIGVFMTFIPAVGVQMLLVVLFAWLLGANKLVGLPVVWLSNPATFGPLYYGCYAVGRFLLGAQAISHEWWAMLAHPPEGWLAALGFYWSRLLEIAAPLSVGCLVLAFLSGLLSYCIVYHLISLYRRHAALLATHEQDKMGLEG